MERPGMKLYHALPWGGAGLALLLATLLKAGGLTLGNAADKLIVALIVCILAALALCVLAAQGYPRTLVWACLFPVALALFLRLLSLDHITLDYEDFLSRWTEAFRAGGGFSALKLDIGNYNVPYLYFLAAVSCAKFPDLYAIKLFSILFDFVLAWGGLRLTRALSGKGSLRPAFAFCLLLLLPTAILNGAYWGQCDSIYASLIMHAIASALRKKPASSVLLLALAFSCKLQSIFLIPLWCILWYSGRIKFRHLLLFPVGYFASIAPALLLGKPLTEILSVYAGQMGQYTHALSLNAPSVFSLIPRNIQVNAGLASSAGIIAAFTLVFLLLALLFPLRRQLEDSVILGSAVILAVGVPFLLPYMHERYFFVADALTLVWACADTRRVFHAAGVQVSSLGGYHAYLRLRYAFPLTLFGYTFPMGAEAVLMLMVLLSAFVIIWNKIGHNDQ